MKSFKREGYFARRLAPNQLNPREIAFASQWDAENERQDFLFMLLNSENRQERDPTEDERKAVATILQWLGSNVGMSFLREALDRCGYSIVEQGRKR